MVGSRECWMDLRHGKESITMVSTRGIVSALDNNTHVARPARISVKKRDPLRSLRWPENSKWKYLPTGLSATRLFQRSTKVMLNVGDDRERMLKKTTGETLSRAPSLSLVVGFAGSDRSVGRVSTICALPHSNRRSLEGDFWKAATKVRHRLSAGKIFWKTLLFSLILAINL